MMRRIRKLKGCWRSIAVNLNDAHRAASSVASGQRDLKACSSVCAEGGAGHYALASGLSWTK